MPPILLPALQELHDTGSSWPLQHRGLFAISSSIVAIRPLKSTNLPLFGNVGSPAHVTVHHPRTNGSTKKEINAASLDLLDPKAKLFFFDSSVFVLISNGTKTSGNDTTFETVLDI